MAGLLLQNCINNKDNDNFKLANQEYDSGNFKEAVDLYSKVIENNPTFQTAYFYRGTSKFNLQDYFGAAKDFTSVIEIDSNNSLAFNSRGISLTRLGLFEEAIEDYNQAIFLNSLVGETYNNRGYAYFRLEEYQKSSEDYDKAIALEPSILGYYYNRALVRVKVNNFAGAIEDFNIVIDQNSDNPMNYLERGKAYFLMQKFNKACADWKKAEKYGSTEAIELIKEKCIDNY